MSFIHVKTIDDKNLWLNLDQITAISCSAEEPICLIEVSGGEHQISLEEFAKIEPILEIHEEKTVF